MNGSKSSRSLIRNAKKKQVRNGTVILFSIQAVVYVFSLLCISTTPLWMFCAATLIAFCGLLTFIYGIRLLAHFSGQHASWRICFTICSLLISLQFFFYCNIFLFSLDHGVIASHANFLKYSTHMYIGIIVFINAIVGSVVWRFYNSNAKHDLYAQGRNQILQAVGGGLLFIVMLFGIKLAFYHVFHDRFQGIDNFFVASVIFGALAGTMFIFSIKIIKKEDD